MAAWNAGDLDAWLRTHHPGAEYVTHAGDEPRLYAGEDGLRRAWDESRANWHEFAFTVAGESDGLVALDFRGRDTVGGAEIGGRLWFRAVQRDGRIARLASGPEPEALVD